MSGRLPQDILRRPKTGKGGTQALLPFLQSLVHGRPPLQTGIGAFHRFEGLVASR